MTPDETTALPRISVVICTDGRAAALANCLSCLRYQDYPAFEVCVVYGPSDDGTDELINEWGDYIKSAASAERNLSASRNIGIALAAAEIIAFIDDDGLAEPGWLHDLAAAYDDPRVTGAGGIVFDHTGVTVQYHCASANRLGVADWARTRPLVDCDFPFSFNFPYLQGTNSSFRRTALLEIGGFDEEYEFYLDETDLCCRLIDAGYTLRQLPRAFVHHKFLPSRIRNEHRVTRDRFSIIKNKIYFSLVNNRGHVDQGSILADAAAFIRFHERDIISHIAAGRLCEGDLEDFRRDAERACQTGLTRGLSGQRRTMTPSPRELYALPYQPFPRLMPTGGRKTFCFISQEYPGGRMGGIGRYVHQMARSVSELGHHVHVLTAAEHFDSVDFEDGVWVHRIQQKRAKPPQQWQGVPQRIWDRSATMLTEIEKIATKRPVTCVYAPMWDCEGVAVLADGRWPLVTHLQTNLKLWLESHPHKAADRRFMREFGTPTLSLERRMFEQSAGIHGISHAIIRELEQLYGTTVAPDRLAIVPLGLEDWTKLATVAPLSVPEGRLRILFVGRLERRKGIDILLQVAAELLKRYPNVHLDIVGNDKIAGPNAKTYRAAVESDPATTAIKDRVIFHGEVDDEQLRGFYRACDILVAPSRYESFCLVLLEGMMFSKPVIGCRTGGMEEVIEEKVTGLLAEPGDAASLESCLESLIADSELRLRFGKAGRRRYESHFTPEIMAERTVELMSRCSDGPPPKLPTASSYDWQPPKPQRPSTPPHKKPRIVVVAPITVRYDAISKVAIDTYNALLMSRDWSVSLLTTTNEFADVPARIVAGLPQLLQSPEFLTADVIIYHFGVYHPYFDALLVDNGHGRQIVWFHSVTPPQLVPQEKQSWIRDGYRQIHNLRSADRVWATSQVSAEILREYGIEEDRIEIMPCPVSTPRLGRFTEKRRNPVELLFVGRLVPSKGVLDLIEALEIAKACTSTEFRLRLVGNLNFSDLSYLQTVKARITPELHPLINILGTQEDVELERLYHTSHLLVIPSYHEGFCKPVIEALRAGCIPVGYNAYNLSYITDGLGRMVPTGDVARLGSALAESIDSIAKALAEPDRPLLHLDRGVFSAAMFEEAAHAYVSAFAFEPVARRLIDSVERTLSTCAAAAGNSIAFVAA